MRPGSASPSPHLPCLARQPTNEAEARTTAQALTRQVTARDRARCVIGEAARVLHCAACGERLSHRRGVLFQSNALLHAGCWTQEAIFPRTAGNPPV
jgi:hypothetical protein